MKDAVGRVQSVAVFGAGSEIAQHIVSALAASGSMRRAVLAARRTDEATARCSDDLRRADIDVRTVRFDASATAEHRAAVADVFSGGDIDVAVLAFAVLGSQADFDRDPAAAADAVAVNFGGSVSIALLVAERMRQQGHGTIVVLSSVAGVRVRAANFVYGSTKAGLDAFAQGLGDSLVGSGVRVMIVRPGFVRTKMTSGMKEVPFTTGPEAVAAAVVEGLASGARIVWSPPALRFVFTGLRALPQAVWRRMPG